MYVYIGRQAIYNQQFNVAGYELLYRRNNTGGVQLKDMDGDDMTRSVLSDAANVFGISNLTNGLPAFINFTRNLIIEDFAYLFNPRDIVVEVPGDIYVDDTLMSKLSALQSSGYRLSLNSYSNFNGRIRFDRIVSIFDIIRMDISQHSRLQLRELLNRLRYSRGQFLAEKVESEQDFEMVQSMKFTLFQGYYFERPDCVSKSVTIKDTPYGRLLNEFLYSYPSFERCCFAIESDSVISHVFLRSVFNAGYNRDSIKTEIQRALALLGVEGVRQWASAMFLKKVNTSNASELPRKAFLRGRFIERLMRNSNTDLKPDKGFFVGMLSLLDQLTGQPLPNALNELQLDPEIAAALLGTIDSGYVRFLQYVIAYENANGRMAMPNIGLRINERQVSTLYMECMQETDKAMADDLIR